MVEEEKMKGGAWKERHEEKEEEVWREERRDKGKRDKTRAGTTGELEER